MENELLFGIPSFLQLFAILSLSEIAPSVIFEDLKKKEGQIFRSRKNPKPFLHGPRENSFNTYMTHIIYYLLFSWQRRGNILVAPRREPVLLISYKSSLILSPIIWDFGVSIHLHLMDILVYYQCWNSGFNIDTLIEKKPSDKDVECKWYETPIVWHAL